MGLPLLNSIRRKLSRIGRRKEVIFRIRTCPTWSLHLYLLIKAVSIRWRIPWSTQQLPSQCSTVPDGPGKVRCRPGFRSWRESSNSDTWNLTPSSNTSVAKDPKELVSITTSATWDSPRSVPIGSPRLHLEATLRGGIISSLARSSATWKVSTLAHQRACLRCVRETSFTSLCSGRKTSFKTRWSRANSWQIWANWTARRAKMCRWTSWPCFIRCPISIWPMFRSIAFIRPGVRRFSSNK